MDLKHYIEDFIDTFSNKELAAFVKEGIITLEEIEISLRRKIKL